MSNTIHILKASALGDEEVPNLTIEIIKPVGEVTSLKEARRLHTEQGVILADALIKALPGGTYDALLAEMMRRRASLFSVLLE